MKKIFIVPIDGLNSTQSMRNRIEGILKEPNNMADFISHIKFNDALHVDGVKEEVLSFIINNFPGINIFFDLKLPDTNGTDKNILGHYLKYMRPGDIVTINSNCSLRAFNDVRDVLPSGVKIALVSVLTDTPPQECQLRRGMTPEMAILNDAINLSNLGNNPFDAVICSPAEIALLKQILPSNIEYALPCIRDEWMDVGQQSVDRINGVREALDFGADFLIMGSQLAKGCPGNNISAVESRKLSIKRALGSRFIHLISGDPLQTLKNLRGYYKSPKDEEGNFKGPLVAYNGTYDSPEGKKNFVGAIYLNLAVTESHPQVISYFAKMMEEKIRVFEKENGIIIDCLAGVPTGGNKIAQEVGRLLNIPGICMEKKITALKTETKKEEFDLVFRRNAGVIKPSDNVVLFEDLCNNFSTTAKAIKVVEDAGGDVIAIACIANRSNKYLKTWQGTPIITGISVPTDQYAQEEPEVSGLISKGLLSTDPRSDWEILKAAMEKG